MYQNGDGLPQDNSQAVEWYRKAANQGLAAAEFNLGAMYEDGLGVTKDVSIAQDWYTKAAAQGDAAAKARLK